MIMIDAAIQGLLSASGSGAGTAFSPVPYAVFVNQSWQSHILLDAGLHDISANKFTLAHKSTDNGVTYTLTNEDTAFGITTSVARIHRFAEIDITGNAIIAYTSGIFVNYKDGAANWVALSLSSIPGGAIGGGSLTSITFDDANNLFVVNKSNGTDINTTADFIAWNNPAGGILNPINNVHKLTVSTIHHVAANYYAYGTGQVSGNPEIWQSTDLFNWSISSATLSGSPFGTNTLLEGLIISGAFFNISWFNGRFIVHGFTQTATPADRVLHIFSSIDGFNWTEASSGPINPDPSVGGQQGENIFVTSSAIEILTNSHVMRSTNGTTWTASLIESNLNLTTTPASNLQAAQAKGHKVRPSTSEAPDHIAIMNVDTLQGDGKLLHLTQTNATPTLGYPAGVPTGSDVEFIQDDFNVDQIIDQGFTLKNSTAQNLIARNSGTRYFEITVFASSNNMKMGLQMLGTTNYNGSDKTFVRITRDLVETSTGNTVVAYIPSPSQVIGFIFNFTASTIEIRVNNVAVHTATSIENARSWVIECAAVSNSRTFLNTGRTAFVHTVAGTVAWNS